MHIMGVGGAGMSALARVLHESGCSVSGCDVAKSSALSDLESSGVTVSVGHHRDHVRAADVLIYSPAVDPRHDEIREARDVGVTVLDRVAVMGELSRRYVMVGIAGTHGKTTTSCMLAHIYAAAGREPSWLIRGRRARTRPGGSFSRAARTHHRS